MGLLAAVVRDAWHQCVRRPLAIVIGVLLIGGSPGFPPQTTGEEVEVGGLASVALIIAAFALAVLSMLATLFMVAYLAGALRPELAGAARALRRTRDTVRPGILALVLGWVVTFVPVQFVLTVFEALVGDGSKGPGGSDPTSSAWDGLALRLVPIWPVVALGFAVLALLLPRIVVDGERDVQRALTASLRVARRAAPICLLIGLFQAAGYVIRAGSSLGVMLAVGAAAGVVAVFGMAMANALLWHTRPLQADPGHQVHQPREPLADREPLGQ